MTRTFGQQIATGFGLVTLLTLFISILAAWALHNVVTEKDRVIDGDARALILSARVTADVAREAVAIRDLLFVDDTATLGRLREEIVRTRRDGVDAFGELRALGDSGDITALEGRYGDLRETLDVVIAHRDAGKALIDIVPYITAEVIPKRLALTAELDRLSLARETRLAQAVEAASQAASNATILVMIAAAISTVTAVAVTIFLTRSVTRQIGSTVAQVQSSSSELQATAAEQATGAREHATAMSEIATTVNELLVTSRQIAESAQRVTQIADETASSSRAGGLTVTETAASMDLIREQVERIVSHMLDLGKKSQQIGAVLDIVSELAEQTNILSINATIEAAGAGEAGRRFGVVADEIRKLADRVGASTKEIRAMIEDVRSAVNTTVMATESGAKAVEAGSRRFEDVSVSFQQISQLVSTTNEAAREIGLSTKQQATAVEQVKVAIVDINQATRDAETGSAQIVQTATQLTTLSREILAFVRPQA